MTLQLRVRPYRLPLRRPWRSARGVRQVRQGWLLALSAGDGSVGYGDCAPLPEAGTEDQATGRRALLAWQRLHGDALRTAIEAAGADPHPTPALVYGLQCALADLQARQAGQPLATYLGGAPAPAVPVNATLGAVASVRPDELTSLAEAGYRVAKIKLGVGSPTDERAHLEGLAQANPETLRWRLDANGAWDPDTAAWMINGLAALPVESLEEPLDQPEESVLHDLQTAAPFPLALDESFHAAPERWVARSPTQRIVIKPAALGGLERTRAYARTLRETGCEVVLTSLFESAAGLWPTLHLAAVAGSPQPHGLATAEWLRQDVGPPPSAEQGHIPVPDPPGSGFDPYRPVGHPLTWLMAGPK